MATRRKKAAATVATLDDLALLLMQTDPNDTAAVEALRAALVAYAKGPGAGGPDGMMVEAAALALGDMDGEAALTEVGACIEAAMNAVGGQSSPPATPAPPSTERARGGRKKATPRATSAKTAKKKAAAIVEPVIDAGAERTSAGNEWGALPPEADAELADGFVVESMEYLAAAEAALLELEARGADVESVNAVFRAFHTIKGTASFLGLSPVATLAHHAESMLSLVRTGEVRLTGGFADIALRSIDMLRVLVDGVRAAMHGSPRVKPEGYDALVVALERAVATRTADTSGTAAGVAAAGGEGRSLPTTPVAAQGEGGTDGKDAWIRVRTDRLDKLVDTIGELVIAQSMIAQDEAIASAAHEALARKVAHASKIVRELQDLSISMRMVPLKPLFQKMARVVRDTAAKSGKRVDLRTVGEDTEIDRNMVDVIGDPLVHMLRNAIDHGIESPDVRSAAGKAEAGTIRLSAYHAGGSVVVELEDDGAGLDRAQIIRKATAQGMIESDRHMTDQDVYALIFAPGFSTAERVTDLSGRGVGMDVVRRSVEALRGRVEIDSTAGRGTRFSMRLPLTLAMTDGMLVRVGTERYIVPTVNIQLSFRPERQALSTIAGKSELVMLRDEPMPILRLHRLFGMQEAETDPTRALLVVIGAGERRCALLVDELLGQQQVVAKSLGQGVGKVPGISGGAILGDGRVGLILDAGEIIQLARSTHDTERAA